MCCDEIVCIENIIDIQATYSILNLSLSMLISDIIRGCRQGVINILDVRVFLRALQNVPFSDENFAQKLILELGECVENELYGKVKTWTVKEFQNKIQKIQKLIMWDYNIGGSLTVYNNKDREIWWDLKVEFIKLEGHGKLFSVNDY
ncbi:MAG: hypothetical protein ACFE9S_18435 [Candidatus Hermodarchaeota archaeon]